MYSARPKHAKTLPPVGVYAEDDGKRRTKSGVFFSILIT
jgi:hypothetical protein